MPWVGFGVAIVFWPGWIGSVISPRWAVLAALTPLVAKVDLKRLDPLSVGLPLFLMLAWATLTLAWTPDPLTGFNELFHLLILVGIVAAVSGLDDLAPVLSATGWGLAVSSVLAVPQFFGWWSPVEQISVPGGLFYNRLMLAEAAAPIFLWAALSRRYWLAVALSPAMLLCQSRVAALAVLIGFLAARPRWALLVLPVAVLASAGAWWLGLPPFDINKMVSTYARLEIWGDALAGIVPAGQGIGSFTTLYPRWEFAHSDILQAWFELGFGSLPIMAFFVVAIRGPVTPERAALSALLVETAISFPLHRPVTAFLAVALAAHLVAVRSGVRGGECRGRDQDVMGVGWNLKAWARAGRADRGRSGLVSVRSDAADEPAAC